MLCVQARRDRNAMASHVPRPPGEGHGIMERKMAEGRWVKTMVLSGPRRRASGRAARFDRVARIFVTRKREPSEPGCRLWTVVKKYVSHEGEAIPDANESRKNRTRSLYSIDRDRGDM
jgi:hypothetical protein